MWLDCPLNYLVSSIKNIKSFFIFLTTLNYLIDLMNDLSLNGFNSHQWWLAFCLKEIYLFSKLHFLSIQCLLFLLVLKWSQSTFGGMGFSWISEQFICPRLHYRLIAWGDCKSFLISTSLPSRNECGKTTKKVCAYLCMLYTCKFIKLKAFFPLELQVFSYNQIWVNGPVSLT